MPVPRLGPDVFDPRQVELIKDTTLKAAANGAAAASNGAGGDAAEQARGPVELSEKAIARMDEAKRRWRAKQGG